MNHSSDELQSDIPGFQRWERVMQSGPQAGAALLTISGPSCAGKSTLVEALASSAPAFLETTAGNPYLPALLSQGFGQFDAAANQEWFLSQMHRFISDADPSKPLVLDQDPAAIVFTYSRMWHDDGKISVKNFERLNDQLLKLEDRLARWRCPRVAVFLDAPATVLHHRASTREGCGAVPPLAWFERIRTYFCEFLLRFPQAIAISTVESSPDETRRRVRDLLQAGS
jgi:deoxyadenosine/deoxycytidine kinase